MKTTKNIEMLSVVARGLRDLREKVVFVGGATIDLYITDPAAPDVRPTDDVDCVIEISGRLEYYALEEKLRELGFEHPVDEPNQPICRWEFSGIKVDIMPTDEKVLGFKNRWYSEGISHSETIQLPDGQTIRIFSAPYMLASKIEAFLDRGKRDFFSSPDFEDFITVVDGIPDIKEKVLKAPGAVGAYLKNRFKEFLREERFLESIPGHVRSMGAGHGRTERIILILRKLAGGD